MLTKVAIIITAIILLVVGTGTALIYTLTNTTPTITPTPTPTVSPTPEPKPVGIDVKVTPWGDMYRKTPDCKQDFSVELFYPNQNTSFTNNNFNVVFHAGAFFWIVEKAYYTSDLFTGQRWIDISKEQYTQDLQKTFTFNLTDVPDGQHELALTVIFHEGTRNNATAFFNVSK